MTISGLFVYPVKSLRGTALERSPVDPRGLRWDRHWMVVDENGRFYSQREVSRMARVSTELTHDSLVLSSDGYGRIEVPFASGGGTIEGKVWSWRGPVDLVDRWLTDVLETPSRLVSMRLDVRRAAWEGEVAFPDGAPVLVLGEASYRDLDARLQTSVPIDRFRANVIVRDSAPYEEDLWQGVGVGTAELAFAGRCARCVMTTIDQRTRARPDREEPLRTLVRERLIGGKACFGANYIVRTTGEIRVGDEVEALGR